MLPRLLIASFKRVFSTETENVLLFISRCLVCSPLVDMRQVVDTAHVTAENPSGESVFHDTRHIHRLVQEPSISIGKRDERRTVDC